MEITAMISEVNFANGYSSFWMEYTPWIKGYVDSINIGLMDRIEKPILCTDEPQYRSINNIVAYTLFCKKINGINSDIPMAFQESVAIINRYPRTNIETYQLSTINTAVIEQLSDRLYARYNVLNPDCSPKFRGCGIMDNCSGDIYYNDTLAEIKSGERVFYPSDIKQLLTYTALNNQYQDIVINNIELYNPRMGLLWTSSIDNLLLSISAFSKADFYTALCSYLSEMSEKINY